MMCGIAFSYLVYLISYNNSNVDAVAAAILAGGKFPLFHPQRTVQTVVPHARAGVRRQVPHQPLRFTEEQAPHVYSDKQKSTEKLPPMPQEKPKNPFKTNLDEYRIPHAGISGSTASYNRPSAPKTHPFRSHNPPLVEDTLELSKISIKIQQARATDTVS
jgi:hypothetical protein